MVNLRTKFLLGLIIFDVFVFAWLGVVNSNPGAVAGWMLSNITVIAIAIQVNSYFLKRRSVSSGHARYHSNILSLRFQKEYGNICTTMKGEVAKSKGEKSIADYLYHKNIRYE